MVLRPENVLLARVEPRYGTSVDPAPPEFPSARTWTTALAALRSLLGSAGLDPMHFGSTRWNPLGELIPEGSRVLLKPNWVLHENLGGGGTECLVTHTTLIEAVLLYLAKARPAAVIVADAPVQGCDFADLRRTCGIDAMLDRCRPLFPSLELQDLRLTIRTGTGRADSSSSRSESDYVRFDLSDASLLAPVTSNSAPFRVTMYDPREMESTHGHGRHCYLVAREAISSDLVISLPKLKTHSKAGLTGALKNMVGINGHKSYLPHHRKGGADMGGDCYEGNFALKSLAEDLLDAANRRPPGAAQVALGTVARTVRRLAMGLGHDRNIEGEWHGNDTVWRMCLDLQRILNYGTAEGVLASEVQRRVITITDAIVAGEGDGPLSPTPVPLGIVSLGLSPPAVEWVHAHVMGLEPSRIPLVSGAFSLPAPRLAGFAPEGIRIHLDGTPVDTDRLALEFPRPFRPARGWVGYCERSVAPASGTPDRTPSAPR